MAGTLFKPPIFTLSHNEVAPEWRDLRGGLVAAFMFERPDQMINWATGRICDVITTYGSGATTLGYDPEGLAHTFSETTVKYQDLDLSALPGTEKWSFFGQGRATAQQVVALGHSSTNTTAAWLQHNSTHRVFLSSALGAAISYSYTSGTLESIGWSKTDTGLTSFAFRLFYFGEFDSLDTSVPVDSSLDLSTIGTRGGSNEWDGTLQYALLWNRSLSDAEHKKVYLNPSGVVAWSPRTVVQGWRPPGGAPPAATPRNLALLGVGS